MARSQITKGLASHGKDLVDFGCSCGEVWFLILFCQRAIWKPLKGHQYYSEMIWLVFLNQQSSCWNEQQKGKTLKKGKMTGWLLSWFCITGGHLVLVIAMEMKTSKGTDKREGVSKLPRRFLYYQVAGALHWDREHWERTSFGMTKITRETEQKWGGVRLPSSALFFQWQNERYHVTVLYIIGMETFMFHMLYKQRKVPGHIVKPPNLFHGM